MKVLGYIDDVVSWIVEFQIGLGNWNAIVVPLEIAIVLFIIKTYTPCK